MSHTYTPPCAVYSGAAVLAPVRRNDNKSDFFEYGNPCVGGDWLCVTGHLLCAQRRFDQFTFTHCNQNGVISWSSASILSKQRPQKNSTAKHEEPTITQCHYVLRDNQAIAPLSTEPVSISIVPRVFCLLFFCVCLKVPTTRKSIRSSLCWIIRTCSSISPSTLEKYVATCGRKHEVLAIQSSNIEFCACSIVNATVEIS